MHIHPSKTEAMRKELPILMSTAMVQAILQGHKTMTRRLVDVDDLKENPGRFRSAGDSREWDVPRPAIKYDDRIWFAWELKNSNAKIWVERCRWKPGDILYVREKWRKYCHVDEYGYTHYDKEIIEFAADNPPMIREVDADGWHVENKDGTEKFIPWRPGIHLPKSASRIWLEVVSIRVERLHDITEEDAKAEGVETLGLYPGYDVSSRGKFEGLWNLIHGDGSWDANPWVWVIEFKVLSTIGKPEKV